MKTIIVTGTPGTGKTAIAKKLARRLKYHYLDVNNLINKYKLSEGYDRKRRTKIIDIKRLNKALVDFIDFLKNYRINGNAPMSSASRAKTLKNLNIKKISIKNQNKLKKFKGIIIDSHLSHYLPKKYADICIVTKCSLNVLEKRLKEKKYDKNKVRENLDAEIFDICLNEANESRHKVIVIDTTKGINIGEISRKTGGLIDI
mgnify:CR=1 FL=1